MNIKSDHDLSSSAALWVDTNQDEEFLTVQNSYAGGRSAEVRVENPPFLQLSRFFVRLSHKINP